MPKVTRRASGTRIRLSHPSVSMGLTSQMKRSREPTRAWTSYTITIAPYLIIATTMLSIRTTRARWCGKGRNLPRVDVVLRAVISTTVVPFL